MISLITILVPSAIADKVVGHVVYSKHASTTHSSTTDCDRTAGVTGWPPVGSHLYHASLSDPSCQCRGSAYASHRPSSALRRSNRPQCHSRLSSLWGSSPAAQVLPPAHDAPGLQRPWTRTAACHGASEPSYTWQADQPVDPRRGRPGQFCPGSDPAPSQRRNHSCYVTRAGGALETSETLDHQSRSGVSPEKTLPRSFDAPGEGASHLGAGLWGRASGGVAWLNRISMEGLSRPPPSDCKN